MNKKNTGCVVRVQFVFVLLLLLVSCDSGTEKYKQDAKAFCDVFAVENWKEFKSELSFEELNDLVIARSKSAVKTKAFSALIEELDKVEFFRDLSPTAKGKIQELTGEEWSCPDYEKFYQLTIRKASVSSEANSKVSEFQIEIGAQGRYFIQGKEIDIYDDVVWGKEISSKVTPDTLLTINMQSGVNDEQLKPLFIRLSAMGVKNVQVISED
ncbi:hypothetical protein [Teredinibacter sp. KSP-S5-2]|uniref:hypothetical protein n=1 Tax=Teredinibacter sp. KSP-S5-2 TaxID=3034506 RepID=UPI002934EADC|nr:hypothetical protein [Teredinibacter sp. KSP-S5-2]WNO10472.1 hypothetical protein P5V12_04735 [Teredinibacter sp. KSP-S5-2]